MAEPSESNLFREIDEELRHEHYAKLWKKYGGYVIGAALVLVLGVAGYQGWHAYDTSTRNTLGERFVNAQRLVDEGRIDLATEEFSKLAAESGGGYRLLARFQEAALLARNGDNAGAVAAYRELSADSGVDTLYRDLAILLEVLHVADTGDAETLGSRLAPLTEPGNPWRHSAREITAQLAFAGGDREGARQLFSQLAGDDTAPSGVRDRAVEMLAIIGE